MILILNPDIAVTKDVTQQHIQSCFLEKSGCGIDYIYLVIIQNIITLWAKNREFRDILPNTIIERKL